MRLAQIPERVQQLSEQYEVPERLTDASKKAYHHLSAAGETARKGAMAAYRTALEHPRTSIGGIILAAALVGGLLWYMFGDASRPVQRRRSGTRMRAGAERRKRHRAARATA
jgi:hypothetical protein